MIDSPGWDNNTEKEPFPITLKPGENSLTFRLREGDGGDYLRVRLATVEGTVPAGISQTLETVNPEPEPVAGDAPSISGIAVSGGKIVVTIDNAKAGLKYGYRFAEHLEDLDDAEVIWLDGPATADGLLPLEHERTTSSGFYRIVVE